MNERGLETGRTAEILREGRVAGQVMKAGFHDELGASPFVVLKDAQGVEHYARLTLGTALPSVGAQATLGVDARGLARWDGAGQASGCEPRPHRYQRRASSR